MCLSVVGERTSCYGGRDGFTQVSGHNVVHLVAGWLLHDAHRYTFAGVWV